VKKKNLDWLKKNYMSFFKDFGIKEDNLIGYYHNWKKEKTESIEDYLWFIFNHLLSENAKQSDNLLDLYKRNERIYGEMISFRRKIENKNANEIQKAYNENKVNLDLETGLNSTFEMEFKIIGVNDCEQSRKISGSSITIEQALKNETIPYENCTRKNGCVCLMSFVPKRDENGSLIRIND
jgi:hypothetical protein